MTHLLETKDLSAGYNGTPVVRDLNLSIDRGEVVALLGPNGAGKTTTMMTLAGHQAPISGHVYWDGNPMRLSAHARARRGIGFVPEGRSVFMRLTVAENLRVGRVEPGAALKLFPELEPLLGRLAGNLSGGEQQILTLARALARHPKLLLADELSLGLAPKVVARLLGALRAAAAEGIGVLLVEQHVHQALRFADRVYVMRRGALVLEGPVAAVRDRVEGEYFADQVTEDARAERLES